MTALTDWLTQARGLVTVATDGPWEAADGMVWTAETPPTGVARYLWAQRVAECWRLDADAAFIAAARTDLPAALDAIQAVLDLTDPDFEPAQSDYECSLTRFDVREAIATALGVSEP